MSEVGIDTFHRMCSVEAADRVVIRGLVEETTGFGAVVEAHHGDADGDTVLNPLSVRLGVEDLTSLLDALECPPIGSAADALSGEETDPLRPAGLNGVATLLEPVAAKVGLAGYATIIRGKEQVDVRREAEARAQFEFLAADDFAAVPRDVNWAVASTTLVEVCYLLGNAERAAYLYEALLPHARRWVNVGTAAVTTGCISRSLGLLATTMRRWQEAEGHFQYALDDHISKCARTIAPLTRFQYAEMLSRRDGSGDRERALSLLQQALAEAQEMGLKSLLERALALKLQIQGVSYRYQHIHRPRGDGRPVRALGPAPAGRARRHRHDHVQRYRELHSAY